MRRFREVTSIPSEVAKALHGDGATYDEEDMEWLIENIAADLATAYAVGSEGSPDDPMLPAQEQI